jgi:hypothetical protein
MSPDSGGLRQAHTSSMRWQRSFLLQKGWEVQQICRMQWLGLHVMPCLVLSCRAWSCGDFSLSIISMGLWASVLRRSKEQFGMLYYPYLKDKRNVVKNKLDKNKGKERLVKPETKDNKARKDSNTTPKLTRRRRQPISPRQNMWQQAVFN